MLPALAGMAVKALLPSGKKVDKDKLLNKKESSAIQKVDSDQGVVKAPTIQKKTISTNLLLPQPEIKALPPAVEVKKDVESGNIKNIFDIVGETLKDIIDVLKNRNQTQKEEQENEKEEAKVEEKKEREEKLEKDSKKKPLKKPNIKLPKDRFNLMRFFGNVLLGSLALAIFKNLEEIIQFFKDIFKKIKDFFEKIGEFFSPVWNALKWIAGTGMGFVNKIKGFFGLGGKTEDEEYAEKAEKELEKSDNIWKEISKFFDIDSSADEEPQLPGPGGETEAPTTGTSVQGGGSDFWTLVAVVSREDGDPQGRADVAQSIYNRLASGAYSGKNIRELILGTWQFEPTWRYPNGPKKGNGKPNSEWLNITDAKSAARATGMSEGSMKSVASQLLNPTLQKNAAEFVQGRTDFTGYSKTQRRGQVQRKSGDNYFGWDWNYKGNKVASVPNFSTKVTKESPQQRQQIADTIAQQAAAQAAAPAQTVTPSATLSPEQSATPSLQPAAPAQTVTPSATLSPEQSATPSLQPAAPAQAQVAPTQAPPAVSASVPQIMQQADYEVPGGMQSTVIPIPMGGGSAPIVMGGGGTRLLPIGVSKQALLNSYYQAQLTGFLYKQG
jgi:hypothetical protein